jgi:transcriptional regulator with XRE-family HTH domain
MRLQMHVSNVLRYCRASWRPQRHALGVAAYRRIERGLTNPGWTTVRAIVAALDVSLTELARELEARG